MGRQGLRVRLQDKLWRRQVHRVRPGLRHHGLRQEVRAQVQTCETGRHRAQGQGEQKAEEGEEEQNQEGPWHSQGQGWHRQEVTSGIPASWLPSLLSNLSW